MVEPEARKRVNASMKILSYNVYGVVFTESPIPSWSNRRKNIKRILDELLKDQEIKVLCFQEINANNMSLIEQIVQANNFKILEKFPMKTQFLAQYNLVAIRNTDDIKVKKVFCLPHGKDEQYKEIRKQVIDYDMSDYRTTVFVEFEYHEKCYLIGNIHTDYISPEGKIKGTVKSLDYMDKEQADYKLIVGDMNMVCHMSEAYKILKQNSNYITLSRSKNFDVSDNSWHGYGTKEQVNVDFAFIEKDKKEKYTYQIMKQNDMYEEGSDHRPVIIEIVD